MAERWRAPGGFTVEVVRLSCTPDKTDGERLRLTQYGSWVADVRTVGELERWIDLAYLEPDLVAWDAKAMLSRVLGDLAVQLDAESRFSLGGLLLDHHPGNCESQGIPQAGVWHLGDVFVGNIQDFEWPEVVDIPVTDQIVD
jgi:hypothetical protein